MKSTLLCFLYFITISVSAQLSEGFNDGDFSQNPKWYCADSLWVINTQNQLQSNSRILNSSCYISTINTRATVAQWEFWVKISFNPSGANYVDVFLISSDSNLLNPTFTGYFVRIGNTEDEISLYRKDNASSVKIIDGMNGILNRNESIIKIKVTRDQSNNWELLRQQNNAGYYISEGNITDSTYLTSAYFGCIIKQSTASFFQKHFFDDLLIGDYIRDTIPPEIDTIIGISKSQIDIQFNESLDKFAAEIVENYLIDNGIGLPTNALVDTLNPTIVHLYYPDNILSRTNLHLSVVHLKDVKGNEMLPQQKRFIFYIPSAFDIIIDELMPDPSPSNGMPEIEWIEIKNISPFDIDLTGWKIAKSTGQSGPFPHTIIKRDSFIVVASTSSAADLQEFTNVIGVTNFPSLTNTSDLIYLMSPEGKTIHAVCYSDEWYKNEVKKQGGWSLEMIDANSPCIGSENWAASECILGASPGKLNSIDAVNIDDISPELLRAFATDSLHIKLYFNEPLDSQSASNVLRYKISGQIGSPLLAEAIPPLFSEVNLTLRIPLSTNKIYEVIASDIKDCIENEIGVKNQVSVSLAAAIDTADLVINEILYNPRQNGFDYIEIYNRSNKVIDIKNLYLANRNTQNEIDNILAVQKLNYLMFPGEYLVFTENKAAITRDYFTPNSTGICQTDILPSYGDDEGTVILLNQEGDIIDQVSYKKVWQFKLLDNSEGVSLERLYSDGNSADENNWHSASSSVGYGTPGYKNSQSIPDNSVKGEIVVYPKIFSPDNDGINDNASIQYTFEENGNVCSVLIFDDAGRLVRKLKENHLCGTNGYFVWDGLNDKKQLMKTGVYVIYIELYNLKGQTKKFKRAVIVK